MSRRMSEMTSGIVTDVLEEISEESVPSEESLTVSKTLANLIRSLGGRTTNAAETGACGFPNIFGQDTKVSKILY